MRMRSRSSKDLKPFANDRECTSVPPVLVVCTTWSTRSWTTRWMRPSPGTADLIDVTILPDGGVRVIDNGRGIPVDLNKAQGRSTVEVVLTVLHAGGKFGGGGYAVSGGLHGVGSSVVNALSTKLDVAVSRQGHVWRQSYSASVFRMLPSRWTRNPTRPARRSRSGRARRSSRPSSSTTRLCAPASSRWRSSTRASPSSSPTSARSPATPRVCSATTPSCTRTA